MATSPVLNHPITYVQKICLKPVSDLFHRIKPVFNPLLKLAREGGGARKLIDMVEAEATVLAKELKATLLIDDAKARKML